MSKGKEINQSITVLNYYSDIPIEAALFAAFSRKDAKQDLVIKLNTTNNDTSLYLYKNNDRKWYKISTDDLAYYGTKGYKLTPDVCFQFDTLFNIEDAPSNRT